MEVEIRFKNLSRDNWKFLYNEIAKNSSGIVEESITISVPVEKYSNNRHEIYFEKQTKVLEKYINKKSLESFNSNYNGIQYKLSVAKETDIPQFSLHGKLDIRLRIR